MCVCIGWYQVTALEDRTRRFLAADPQAAGKATKAAQQRRKQYHLFKKQRTKDAALAAEASLFQTDDAITKKIFSVVCDGMTPFERLQAVLGAKKRELEHLRNEARCGFLELLCC